MYSVEYEFWRLISLRDPNHSGSTFTRIREISYFPHHQAGSKLWRLIITKTLNPCHNLIKPTYIPRHDKYDIREKYKTPTVIFSSEPTLAIRASDSHSVLVVNKPNYSTVQKFLKQLYS